MWIEDTNAPYWAVNLTTANALHTLGFKFNVTVWLNMTNVGAASGIDTWQVKLYFNKTQLHALRTGYTEGATSQLFAGLTTTSVTPVIDNILIGYVTHGESCVLNAPPYKPVPCSGSLIWIEFNVTKVPPKGGTLRSLFRMNTTETAVVDNLGNFYPPGQMTKYFGFYEFKWEPPPPALMAVEHDGFYGVLPPSIPANDVWPVTWGPYPPTVNGSAFDAKIYIENLAAAWNLTSASFCLCYNTSVIDTTLGNITLNTAVWKPVPASVITIVHGVPDEIDFTVYPKAGVVPSGKVLVATVKFYIYDQKPSPPYPMGYYDKSQLNFCDVYLEDHTRAIDTTDPKNGEVRILAMVAIPLGWLEVSPKDTVLETEPCHTVLLGKEFDINIIIKNMHPKWTMIAWQLRLSFDETLLQLVDATEGPFLLDARWNLYGTFFTFIEKNATGPFPHHVAVGGIIMPNPDTGEWDQTVWPTAPGPDVPDLDPPVNPVVATITFKAIKQNCFGESALTCAIDIFYFWPPEDYHWCDKDGNIIPSDVSKMVNGTYTIMPMYQYGRIIDVYGGAVNRGYGTAHGTSYKGVGVIWPSPYGGQGVGGNMDLVIPQSVVYLFAYVTYNCWPVQSKDVGFEIEGPYEQEGWTPEQPVPRAAYHVRKYSNRTDTGDCQNPGGVAWIKFQMLWPCDNPEEYLGKYKVTVSVDICGVVVTDVLWFDYYYLVEITKVTTDKYCYPHCNDAYVTIEYRWKAQQYYPVLFAIVVQDELETAFGYATIDQCVGGAPFCHWRYWTDTVTIHIVKWAFAGIAHICVSAFDKDPTVGGAPWCATFTPLPEICIYPY